MYKIIYSPKAIEDHKYNFLQVTHKKAPAHHCAGA